MKIIQLVVKPTNGKFNRDVADIYGLSDSGEVFILVNDIKETKDGKSIPTGEKKWKFVASSSGVIV